MNCLRMLGTTAALLALLTTAATALDRRVEIVNNTSTDIEEFYASNVGTDNWEEDILGEDVLQSGYSVVVNIDDRSGYCKFDFKAVFSDGTSTVSKRINVCSVSKYTYND